MFEQMPLLILSAIFAAAGIVVWIAGVFVSKTTDVLSARFKLGEALGGAILLAIVTNVPEFAVTASGALHKQLGVATGNMLGGIAIERVGRVSRDGLGVGQRAADVGRA